MSDPPPPPDERRSVLWSVHRVLGFALLVAGATGAVIVMHSRGSRGPLAFMLISLCTLALLGGLIWTTLAKLGSKR